MQKAIQYSMVLVMLIILISPAIGFDAFDQTVNQIKALETELDENQTLVAEQETFIAEQLTALREEHDLNPPQGEFESDADYATRINELVTQMNSAVSKRRDELEEEHLSPLQERNLEIQNGIRRLRRTVFLTENVTATLGTYDANAETFPITFEVNNQSFNTNLFVTKSDAPNVKQNWDQGIKTAHISIDPGYRRGVAALKLAFPPLGEEGFEQHWVMNRVYRFGNSQRGAAFSSNRVYLATGDGSTVSIYDINSGERVWHKNVGYAIYAVSFSPNGTYLAIAGEKYVSLWEVESGKRVWRISISYSGSNFYGRYIRYVDFNALNFSPNGRYLATGDTRYISLWEVESGKRVWRISNSYSGSNFYGRYTRYADFDALNFSPNGQYIATGDTHTDVIVREVSSGGIIRKMNHADDVYAVGFILDGKYVAAGGADNKLTIWELSSGQSVHEKSFVTSIQSYADFDALNFSPNGQYIATGDTHTDVIVREVSSGGIIRKMNHADDVYAVGFILDGKYVAAGGADNKLTIWELSSGQSVHEKSFVTSIQSMAYSPDGEHLAVGLANGVILFYNLGGIEEITIETEIPLVKSISTSYAVTDLAWHPDGNVISDGKSVYRTVLNPIFTELAATPLPTRKDVNRDGAVDIDDLILVASNFGKSFTVDASPNPDVNQDGVVDRKDVLEIITALEDAAGAPSAHPQLTAVTLQHWIDIAKQFQNKDETYQSGIRVLEQLLATLIQREIIPEKTALLPNYPNPFNPETWIPYQLSKAADVKLTIFDINGRAVRDLDLGHQPSGVYQSRNRAAYWDGRNALGEPVASGLYFYTLTAGEFTATRKMLIRK